MVIFSHILSLTSRPDSGLAMALTTSVMSLWMFRWFSSCTPGSSSDLMMMDDGSSDTCCLETYCSVGGASRSWRRCETPTQQGRWDGPAHLWKFTEPIVYKDQGEKIISCNNSNNDDSLLGSVKQPRGFGSQHFATVNVTGLQTGREPAYKITSDPEP